MSLDVFQACLNGYSDHLFDMQILGVQSGYWAGYFGRTKKPKSLKSIIENLFRQHTRGSKKSNAKQISKPEVDIAAFQAMEQQFQARRKKFDK